MKKNLRLMFALMLALVLMAALTVPAFADSTEVFAADMAGGSYDGSLFVAGSNAESAAVVRGIVFAAGQDVNVGGIGEYAMAAGYSVNAGGSVLNDAFLAGYGVNLMGDVGRDAFAAGNVVTVNGAVGRSLYAAGSMVSITGKVAGDVYVNADSLVISETAAISGTVHVNDNAKLSCPASVKVVTYADTGKADAAPAPIQPANTLGRRLVSWALSFLGVAAVAFVLLWLTPLWETVDKKYYAAPFVSYAKAFGIGFAVLAGLPVAAILLMLMRFGVRLALILMGVYFAAIAAAPVFLGFFLGALIWRRALKKAPCYFAELPIGILVVRIAYCIPGLSFAVGLVAVPLGLGVVTLLLGKKSAPAALPETEDAPVLPEKAGE